MDIHVSILHPPNNIYFKKMSFSYLHISEQSRDMFNNKNNV